MTFKDLQAHGVFPTLCSLGFSEARGGGVGFCLLFTRNLQRVYKSNFKRNPFLAQPQHLPATDNLVRSTSDIPPTHIILKPIPVSLSSINISVGISKR